MNGARDWIVTWLVPRWALRLYRNLRYGFARSSACDDCPMCREADADGR